MASSKGNAFDFGLFKKLLSYTKPYQVRMYFVAISAVLISICAVLRPIYIEYAIDEGMQPKDMDNLIYYIGLSLLVLLGESIFQLLFIYFANWLGQQVVLDIRTKLFKHMIYFKMQYYDKSAVGRLVTRAVNDIETIASIFSQGLFMIISDLLKMLVIAGVMLYKSWQLSLIVFAILPFILYATRVFQQKMKVAFEEVRTQVANLNSFVQERVTGMKIVQIFSREAVERKKFNEINQKHMKAWNKTVWYNSIFFPIAEMVTSITIGLLVWYGGLRAAQSDVITIGLVTAFIQFSQMLFTPLRQIADKFNTLQMGMVAANRVFGILETEARIEDNGTHLLSGIKGDLSFENVRFSYVQDEEVLRGINLEVKAGETVAIVGSTGAGKSTIINLLGRFYEIDSGTIKIDGVDIRDVQVASLRSEIAVVLQDVFLFADSILNNITLNNPEISEEDVVAAAKAIG
ncbi:MAG TPA: antibiotic ABC transporter ATP-binding protein, partial [Leeuwenhoekiella sp.]|nr:antibiotic ABC transporter ATP-binding protein [Leeuwenhoekiella sp.]